LEEAKLFARWAVSQADAFREASKQTTRHGRLLDVQVTLEGNHVYLLFHFATGDAAGQNMVTVATDAICAYIESTSPIGPQYWFIEANVSGDKKASSRSLQSRRGRRVSAEVRLHPEIVLKRLHTTPERMADYWRMAALGGVLSGTIGVQGQYANGLTALYLACGQDVACVAESAVGVTRFEVTREGELYCAVTLPDLAVGTVGGGTELPSQRACLEILGLAGPGHAPAFVEVCAAVCLAGEISLAASLCAGTFARAHRVLARTRRSRSGRRKVDVGLRRHEGECAAHD
jgi:hydroxymethylglutaryl-CoA reductase (NADPH)